MMRPVPQLRGPNAARARRADGFTLAELVISMAIMALLIGSMTSAVLIASHALPDRQDPVNAAAVAARNVDRVASECAYAVTITQATDKAFTFTVADRGHGAAGAETICYAWSGTAGDPLTRQYNGGSVIPVCENVQLFRLTWFGAISRLEGAPRVLLVVQNASSLSADDQTRKATFESWGCTVQAISSSTTQASVDSAVAASDVAFLSEELPGTAIAKKLYNKPIGVLIEQRKHYPEFGISPDSGTSLLNSIQIVDNTHEITKAFSTGSMTICSLLQLLTTTSGSLGSGEQVLATELLTGRPMLVAVEPGAVLCDGGEAAGRRVKLPSGETGSFDFSGLNSNGLTLTRRALNWAAAPHVYCGVQIILQVGPDPAGRVQTRTEIYNSPNMNGS